MTTPFEPEPLSSISYLDLANLADRTPILFAHWDGAGWHTWIPAKDGRFFHMRPADAQQCDYVGSEAASSDDLFIPFVDLLWQRAGWSDVNPYTRAIMQRFHKLCACVAKLQVFKDEPKEKLTAFDQTAFGETEIEYMLTVCRTIFDLLQEAIRTLWKNHVTLNDNGAEKKRRGSELPKSFNDMLTKLEQEKAPNFGLPEAMCEAYERQREFFGELRSLRDRVVHGTGQGELFFWTEHGLAVQEKGSPFGSLANWDDSHRYNKTLVSVLPLMGRLVMGTVEACNDLFGTFASLNTLPPEQAPGMHVFVRGPHSFVVGHILQAARGELAWLPPRPVSPP